MEFGMLVFEERGKPEFLLKKKLAEDEREPTGANAPDKRWLLKQYSHFMSIIKTLLDYF